MDRIQQLDAIVEQYNLNGHPFYQAWREGTLPVEKLQAYSVEYAAFVDTIDEGWEAIGEKDYADEERVHEELWADFQTAIGSTPGRATLGETDTLVAAARNNFKNAATAVGALYAFEAQQPHTSASKLAGLEEHYNLSAEGKEYFRIHADDVTEAASLRERALTLSDEDFARTRTACSVVCSAMWGALDAIYYGKTATA